ncbi:MAG: polyprenol monophosphomannose synthase [Ilumatobacteraceae bacterium]
MRVAVMTPTYNERDNIDEFVSRVRSAVPTAEVFVVDDNSPDGTATRVAELAAGEPRLHLLLRRGERGYAAASREGLSTLSTQGFDAIITIDCDLSHDPGVIPLMLQRLSEGADVVIGSRYVPGGGVRNWSLFRRLLSRWGNTYTAFLLRLPIRDCTTGFRAYRADVVRRAHLGATVSDGYAFLTESLLRIHELGDVRIDEVPIIYVERTQGESKMSKTIISESMRRVTWWGVQRRLGG